MSPEIIQSGKQREKRLENNEYSCSNDLWDNGKRLSKWETGSSKWSAKAWSRKTEQMVGMRTSTFRHDRATKNFILKKNNWNNSFQDIGHQARKDSGPWETESKASPVIAQFCTWKAFPHCHREVGIRWNPAISLEWEKSQESGGGRGS